MNAQPPSNPVTIRLWNACTVVGVVSVSKSGGSTFSGAVGGADNSAEVDIEMDPWTCLIVDHRPDPKPSPVQWVDADRHECGPVDDDGF